MTTMPARSQAVSERRRVVGTDKTSHRRGGREEEGVVPGDEPGEGEGEGRSGREQDGEEVLQPVHRVEVGEAHEAQRREQQDAEATVEIAAVDRDADDDRGGGRRSEAVGRHERDEAGREGEEQRRREQQPRDDRGEGLVGGDGEQEGAGETAGGGEAQQGAEGERAFGADVSAEAPCAAHVAGQGGQRRGCIRHNRRHADPDEHREGEESAAAGDGVESAGGEAGEAEDEGRDHDGTALLGGQGRLSTISGLVCKLVCQTLERWIAPKPAGSSPRSSRRRFRTGETGFRPSGPWHDGSAAAARPCGRRSPASRPRGRFGGMLGRGRSVGRGPPACPYGRPCSSPSPDLPISWRPACSSSPRSPARRRLEVAGGIPGICGGASRPGARPATSRPARRPTAPFIAQLPRRRATPCCSASSLISPTPGVGRLGSTNGTGPTAGSGSRSSAGATATSMRRAGDARASGDGPGRDGHGRVTAAAGEELG